MAIENESALAETDDFDLTAALSAEFDKAEANEAAPAEPADEGRAPRDDNRDDKGRFAPKAAKVEAEPVKAAAKDPVKDVATDAVQDPAAALKADVETKDAAPIDASRPPPGWSPAAKAAYAELPPDHPIRLAVAKREVEVDKGLAKLQEYKPIERYAEMARQSGTTLDRALESYVGIENTLRQDFLGGITQICQRQGINPLQLANAIVTRYGGSPANGDASAAQTHQNGHGVDLSPIMQELTALKTRIAQQDQMGVKTEIEKFASDPNHLFFENVKSEMGRLLDLGLATGLPDAYEKACWSNPEIRAVLIKQQSTQSDASAKAAAATQARAASKSITGSPVPGAAGRGPELSLEDEIRAQFDAASV